MKNYSLLILIILTSIAQAQIVDIPDSNFKNALLNYNPVIDTNGDNEIQISEAEAVINLNVEIRNIFDLEGLQAFINLEFFSCYFNNVSQIDLTNMPNLKKIECGRNNLTALDVSQNLNLEELFCSNSPLNAIDVSQNINLERLYIRNNQISSIDVSQNPNLIGVYFDTNQLSSLNLKNGNNTNLIFMTAQGNPELLCINVDDANYSDSNPDWEKDSTAEYSESCVFGIGEFNEDVFTIHPVPTKDKLFINARIPIDKVIIYSSMGEILLQSEYTELDVSSLKSGVYLITIMTGSRTESQKFIKL